MRLFSCLLFCVCLFSVSCRKAVTSDVSSGNGTSRIISGQPPVTNGQYYYYNPAGDSVWTDCNSQKPVKTKCGTFKGGLKSETLVVYPSSASIRISHCDESLSIGQKVTPLILQDSLCGANVVTSIVRDKQNRWVEVTIPPGPHRDTYYYAVIVLANGKKLYSNPILITVR